MLGTEIEQVPGRDVYGADGEKIGTACQVLVDDLTGEPAWMTVRTEFLGSKESLVLLIDAEMHADRLTVPCTKDFVLGAPTIEDGGISPDLQQQSYAYYRRAESDDRAGARTLTDKQAVAEQIRKERVDVEAHTRGYN